MVGGKSSNSKVVGVAATAAAGILLALSERSGNNNDRLRTAENSLKLLSKNMDLHTRKEVFSKQCAKLSSPFSTRFERVLGNCGQHVQTNRGSTSKHYF